jgi:hypothetical protein
LDWGNGLLIKTHPKQTLLYMIYRDLKGEKTASSVVLELHSQMTCFLLE